MKMTFNDIALELLNKKNCSIQCGLGYIQDLHRFVQTDVHIVNKTKNPRESKKCLKIKENLKYLLDNFDSFKTGSVNTRIK